MPRSIRSHNRITDDLLTDDAGNQWHRVRSDLRRDAVVQLMADRAETAVSEPSTMVEIDAVLLFDGVFLQRPELIECWDLCIFVSAAFEETLARARIRDLAALGSVARVDERCRRRYLPSQQHYFATVRPTELADIVVYNDEPERPLWILRSRCSVGPGPDARGTGDPGHPGSRRARTYGPLTDER